MWINLDTREIREVKRDSHGRFRTSAHPEYDPSAAPEPSPAPSHEAREWKHCTASGWVDPESSNPLLVQCDQKPGHVGDHYDSSVGRAFQSSQEGAQD